MSDETDYKTAGMRQSVLCASAGLFVALLINVLFGTIYLAAEFPVSIIAGIIGLYLCAYFYGLIAGKIVYRVGAGSFAVWLVGIFLAWSCVITMSAGGGLIYFFKELNRSNFGEAFFDYIFKPVYWIAGIGFVPSLILGLIWAKAMRKKFRIAV